MVKVDNEIRYVYLFILGLVGDVFRIYKRKEGTYSINSQGQTTYKAPQDWSGGNLFFYVGYKIFFKHHIHDIFNY